MDHRGFASRWFASNSGSPATRVNGAARRKDFRRRTPDESPRRRYLMFDSQSDLAALVYEHDEDPDRILRDFASDLNRRCYRAVGLVQLGHDRPDTRQLSALLVHTGEKLSLFHDLRNWATGCRMDVNQLLQAAGQIADEIDQGADVVIVNRFGQQEREGKGLAYLIERALSVDIPVVIAVSSHRFADWIKFVDGMSVKLHCNRDSLDAWWNALSSRNADPMRLSGHTVCEILK
jgi:hypothetical protein